MVPHFYLRNPLETEQYQQLSDKAKQSILLSKSEATIKAYEADWTDFVDWCTYRKVNYFPSTPEIVVNYINDYLVDHAKANTISRRISALSENFTAGGITDNPCHSPLVRQALRGIRRAKGTYQQGKTPILIEDLEEIFAVMPTLDLSPIQMLRDKAILLIGFMGAFRRSEISALQVEHIKFHPQGMELFIPSSKADQEGLGSTVAIPYVEDDRLCAVQATKYWLRHTHMTEGPLFRGFTKSLQLKQTALSDKSIANIVKFYVEAIGLNPSDYGAHSLRHGFATTAAYAGVEERHIMKQTRHHSVNMVRRYINEANTFTNHPITTIFKKRT